LSLEKKLTLLKGKSKTEIASKTSGLKAPNLHQEFLEKDRVIEIGKSCQAVG
jgi:hypothetical protein